MHKKYKNKGNEFTRLRIREIMCVVVKASGKLWFSSFFFVGTLFGFSFSPVLTIFVHHFTLPLLSTRKHNMRAGEILTEVAAAAAAPPSSSPRLSKSTGTGDSTRVTSRLSSPRAFVATHLQIKMKLIYQNWQKFPK